MQGESDGRRSDPLERNEAWATIVISHTQLERLAFSISWTNIHHFCRHYDVFALMLYAYYIFTRRALRKPSRQPFLQQHADTT